MGFFLGFLYVDRQRDIELRLDIVLMVRENNQCFIVDVIIFSDVRVIEKELEKVQKYQDLSQELVRVLDYRGDCCFCGDWCIGYCIWKVSQVFEDDWSDNKDRVFIESSVIRNSKEKSI